MRSQHKHSAAFTLIELLVVIAIILLLLSIIQPATRRGIAIARSTACKVTQKQVNVALWVFMAEHRNQLPESESANMETALWSEYPWNCAREELWMFQLARGGYYSSESAAWRCPGDPYPGKWAFQWDETKEGSDVTYAVTSYAVSYNFRHEYFAWGGFTSFKVGQPSAQLFTVEVGPDPGPTYCNRQDYGIGYAWRDAGAALWDDGLRGWSPAEQGTWLTARHYGGINATAFDGRVVRVETEKMLSESILTHYSDSTDLYNDYAPHYNFSPYGVDWYTGGGWWP